MTFVGGEVNRRFAFVERLRTELFVEIWRLAVKIVGFELGKLFDLCLEIDFETYKKIK